MTRKVFIEQVRRLIYGGQPSDDAEISRGLVNTWMDSAIAYAAKQNYTDSIKLDGISYVNNSFYTKFDDISVSAYGINRYRITLPHLPFGLGQDEGVPMLQFKDSNSQQTSQSVVWLTQNQQTFAEGMRPIPNKLLAYSQGKFVYVISALLLNQYTANVTMVSGGDKGDLNSELNVPSDYHPLMIEYLKKQLMFERSVPVDDTNDGLDAITTT